MTRQFGKLTKSQQRAFMLYCYTLLNSAWDLVDDKLSHKVLDISILFVPHGDDRMLVIDSSQETAVYSEYVHPSVVVQNVNEILKLHRPRLVS